MANMILTIAGLFICTGTVLDAYYKVDGQVKKLVVKLGLMFSSDNVQYVYETMCIEHADPKTFMIGRNRAYKLSLACGLTARPDDPSVLIGEKVQVSFNIDDNGNIRIKKFDKIDGMKVEEVEASNEKDLF